MTWTYKRNPPCQCPNRPNLALCVEEGAWDGSRWMCDNCRAEWVLGGMPTLARWSRYTTPNYRD